MRVHHLFSFLLLLISVHTLFPQRSSENAGSINGRPPLFSLYPLSEISFGLLQLATNHPVPRYTFPNADGTFADRGLNYYFIAGGRGSISDIAVFDYDLRANNIEGLRFKKGSLRLFYGRFALEFGRNNIWIGPSFYGSLLLSNNAEPYTLARLYTTESLRIPYLGRFNFHLFHGWPRKFKILGHRIEWSPVSWFSLGLNQTVIYTDRYTFGEYLLLLIAQDANVPGKLGRSDTRASIDAGIELSFLKTRFPGLKEAQVYIEYGGEDLYAYWQTDDDLWVGPFGFEFLEKGYSFGFHFGTELDELRFEYSQNYRNHYLFYDPYGGERRYSGAWYLHSVQEPFENGGAIMGHHMGSAAESYVTYYERKIGDVSVSLLYNLRYRNLIRLQDERSFKVTEPEKLNRVVAALKYSYFNADVSAIFGYNYYENRDRNADILVNEPEAGRIAREIMLGIKIGYRFY